MPDEELDLVLGDHPIFAVEEETPAVEEAVEETPQEDEEQYFVRLDKRNLQQQLLDFVNQDPDARQIYNRSVGNQAAKRYQPRIQELEAERDTYRQLLLREQYSRLTPEEVNQRFQNDPEFARNYAAITHSNVQPPNTEATLAAVQENLVAGIRNIVGAGQRQGLTEQDLAEIAQAMQSGVYDKDETGTDLPPSMWREVLENVQEDVTRRIVANRTRVETPETPTQPPVETLPTTPRVDSARPDMAQPGTRGVRTTSITMREFKQLPWEEQFSFIGDGSVEQAVADGRITVEGQT